MRVHFRLTMNTVPVSTETIRDLIADLQEGIDYAAKCEVHDFMTPVPKGKVTYPGAVGKLTSKLEMQVIRLGWMLDDAGVLS